MAYREDLDMGKITLISLVSVLVMIALLLFLQVLYFGFHRRQLASAKYNQPDADLTKYVTDQQGQLMSIRVVDRERQVATIPVDTAMELVVAQLKSDPAANVTGVPDPDPPADQAEAGEVNGDEKESADPDKSAPEDEAEEDDVPAADTNEETSDDALTADDLPVDNDLEMGDPPPITGGSLETDAEDESNGDP
jgi:hypothetical protein